MEETLGNETTGRWKARLTRLTMLILVTFVIPLVAYPAIESAAFFRKG